jgi:Domain of unknown function (DUF6430)
LKLKYTFESVCTVSFWKHALFSKEALASLLGAIGTIYLFVQILDFFHIYKQDMYSGYAVIPIIISALLFVVFSRRPVSRVRYKVPKKDLSIEVRIGDLLSTPGEMVISSSSTFDTDMGSELISTQSLQGQFAVKFFNANTSEIDEQIEKSLQNVQFELNNSRPGKKKEYPIGTVAKIKAHSKNFYFLAMSHMNESGNASSTIRMVDDALENLWKYMAEKAELGDIVMPLIGTGRGRINIPRKKVVEKIAQSFADASQDKIFSNRLIIVISEKDASNFAINLFQIKDYLSQSLHV